MKNIYLVTALILFAFTVSAQSIADDFESVRKVDYGFIHGEHFEYTPNPNPGGINVSDNVAWYVRNPVELFDVLIIETDSLSDLTDYLSGTKNLKLDIFSPAPGIPIQITLEDTFTAKASNYPTGRHSVYLDTTTVGNAWETLTFNFDNRPDAAVPNNAVNRVVLLFNPNTLTTNNYYWDNLVLPELVNDPCTGVTPDANVFNDFECNQNFSVSFRHGLLSRKPNPNKTGNTSSHVARYERNAGETDDVVVGQFGGTLGLSVNSQISLSVYDLNAPSVIVVAFQDALGNDVIVFTDSVKAGEGNQWVDFNWDASAAAGTNSVTQFVLLYEPGQNVSDIMYFDNLKVSSSVGIDPVRGNINSMSVIPNLIKNEGNITFNIENSNEIQFDLFDIQGKRVKSIADQYYQKGQHSLTFSVDQIPNGIYFIRLKSGQSINTEKIIISK